MKNITKIEKLLDELIDANFNAGFMEARDETPAVSPKE